MAGMGYKGGGVITEEGVRAGATGVQKVASIMSITLEKLRENCVSEVSCLSFTARAIFV